MFSVAEPCCGHLVRSWPLPVDVVCDDGVMSRQLYKSRRLLLHILAAVCGLVFISFILLIPTVMRGISGDGATWHELSEIGQAYGGVSAVLSGLAFCGVAISLILQSRQNRLTQVVSARERHFELVKLALERPELMFQRRTDESIEAHGKKMYLNLWVAHWGMLWDVGSIDRTSLRQNFVELFRDEVSRQWWSEWGQDWGTVRSRERREFMQIATNCYRAALQDEPAGRFSADAPPPTGSHSSSDSAGVPMGRQGT
ncbi:DUF6082 family protein [Plantactinospora sp. CA-290183]|uniref:DUF6082 family protein n=1 Tax=Plantactinospora sp. CA-290183 TaxID=3240006 RepID=UPI003D8E1596